MLLDEARIAAKLHHPNVVPIVDLGAAQAGYYLAMEYVEGCSCSAGRCAVDATELDSGMLDPDSDNAIDSGGDGPGARSTRLAHSLFQRFVACPMIGARCSRCAGGRGASCADRSCTP